MSFNNYVSGEIVHDLINHAWAQFIEEKGGMAVLYNSLGDDREVDIDDIIKAELPLGLDALGFRLFSNDKKGTEKYKHNENTVEIVDGKYLVNNKEITYTVDVQIAFNQFRFIHFTLLERRMVPKIKRDKKSKL